MVVPWRQVTLALTPGIQACIDIAMRLQWSKLIQGQWFCQVAGSTSYVPRPLADSCWAINRLHGTIRFPSLERLQQSLATVSPFHSTLRFILLSMNLRLQAMGGGGSLLKRFSSCQSHSIQEVVVAFYYYFSAFINFFRMWINFPVFSNFTLSHLPTDLIAFLQIYRSCQKNLY